MSAIPPTAGGIPVMRDGAARVCVVGNAAMDATFGVDHLPAPGETVIAIDTVGTGQDFGGKGANQALLCARAGISTTLFAALGNDADGERYVTHLVAEGVDISFLSRTCFATDVSMITVDRHGENTIVTRSDAASQYRPDPEAVLACTRAGDWVALQGNLQGNLTHALLRAAQLAGRRTFLNPGPVQFACQPMLPHVDVLVVNQVEAYMISAEREPAAAAMALHRGGARTVVVTQGADGVLYCDEGGVSVDAAPVTNAIDTVGAGDAFCGVLLAGMARRLSFHVALKWAQSAAAYSVARHGAQASFPSSAILRDVLAQAHGVTSLST